MDDLQLAKAEKALIKADPRLGTLIQLQKPIALIPRHGYFASLCRSIIGQQISVSAAVAIFSRFEKTTNIVPEKVAKLSEKQIKFIGLSRQKAAYLKDLAQHFVEEPRIYDHLEKLKDEEVIKDLIKIKGIGVWSAQMFLLFTLARPDVFATDDVGLQRAIVNLYGYKSLPDKKSLVRLSDKWKPYRTIASLHLWESLKNNPLK